MIIYLVRHGQDDDTIRGGWSDAPLTDIGIEQSRRLAEQLDKNKNIYDIQKIYTSDLKRAAQTAEILADTLKTDLVLLPQFREVNNGRLAGMKNETADKQYPGLYWRRLEWEQKYPDGESPKEFYERIKNAWTDFKSKCIKENVNAVLVTHGGVINIIRCIENGEIYANKNKYPAVKSAELITIFSTEK